MGRAVPFCFSDSIQLNCGAIMDHQFRKFCEVAVFDPTFDSLLASDASLFFLTDVTIKINVVKCEINDYLYKNK